jgi:hypothetical protein
MTPQQRIWRDRMESLIGLAAPWLDLMLSVGDRVSRLMAPEDRDYYPIRAPGESFELDAAQARGPASRRADTVD